MSGYDVRPFRRADREQVTLLVNRHASAVIPGVSASVSTVLNQFEREPDEFIVGPWVEERRCLVAEQDGSVVAAALLARYGHTPAVGPAFLGAGEIRWLLFWPEAPWGNPFWRPAREAATGLGAACLDQLRGWKVTRAYADGALPLPGVYGVPEQWPHVASLYADLGFTAPADAVEVLHLVDLTEVPPPQDAPLPDLRVVRTVGINGTRFSANLGSERVAYLEVEVLDPAERHARGDGLADVGNLEVADAYRRRGLATFLLRHAARWLRLAHVDRLLHYATPADVAAIAFAQRNGFTEVTRTRRGWELPLMS